MVYLPYLGAGSFNWHRYRLASGCLRRSDRALLSVRIVKCPLDLEGDASLDAWRIVVRRVARWRAIGRWRAVVLPVITADSVRHADAFAELAGSLMLVSRDETGPDVGVLAPATTLSPTGGRRIRTTSPCR